MTVTIPGDDTEGGNDHCDRDAGRSCNGNEAKFNRCIDFEVNMSLGSAVNLLKNVPGCADKRKGAFHEVG